MKPLKYIDKRSTDAAKYRKLYHCKRWYLLRAKQLRSEPFCRWCWEKGRTVLAEVVHHEKPELKANPATFYAGPFVSLCKPCHDAEAQGIEIRGYSKQVRPDGWPLDPNHPSYT